MIYQIILTTFAEEDLDSLSEYISDEDSPAKAVLFLSKISKQLEGLRRFPYRGRVLIELAELGIQEKYREVFFKSYRIIYKIIESTVYIYVIADGRRDMRALLAKRLLRD